MRGLRLVAAFPALLVALLLVGAACGGSDDPTPEPSPTADSVGSDVAAEPTATATATVRPTGTSTRTPTEVPSPTPTPTPFDGAVVAMRLPSLDVKAAIENIGLVIVKGKDQLDVPHDPHNVGWYDIYDKPGFGKNAVFSAHVDYWPDIRGPFNKLTDLEHGDEIIVVMEDGREYVYEVFFRERYAREETPMGDLISPPDRPEDEEWITLITCGGDFRATNANGSGEYLHRDVVVAKRVA